MENRVRAFHQTNSLVKQFSLPSPVIGRHLQLSSDTGLDLSMQFSSDYVSPASLLCNVSLPGGQSRPSFLGNDRSDLRWGSYPGPYGPPEVQSNLVSPPSHHGIPSVSTPSSYKLTVAKDYVESLLQNEKSPLLYGKNNVMVQPSHCSKKILGYLSLHRLGGGEEHGLLLKWMPNKAMSSEPADCDLPASPNTLSFRLTAYQKSKNSNPSLSVCTPDSNSVRPWQPSSSGKNEISPESSMASETSTYWDFALNIELDSVVYIHCHHLRKQGAFFVLTGSQLKLVAF
ncbi:unnamed protein product [Dibothriocephalus latus]|uniref:Small G protein signalling modulator 1/2 Rab-binding domain-containing protein n=1 Tax=Dibothriocephalus latus TaxID=60516 RepID=A0A3P7LHF6_DIBLA|nr:unnamed protein product [Dibothriocephalus latus]